MASIVVNDNVFAINLSKNFNSYDFYDLISVNIVFKTYEISVNEVDHYMERDDVKGVIDALEAFCEEDFAELAFDFSDRNVSFSLDKEYSDVLIEAFLDFEDSGFYVDEYDVKNFVNELKNEYHYVVEGSAN